VAVILAVFIGMLMVSNLFIYTCLLPIMIAREYKEKREERNKF